MRFGSEITNIGITVEKFVIIDPDKLYLFITLDLSLIECALGMGLDVTQQGVPMRMF